MHSFTDFLFFIYFFHRTFLDHVKNIESSELWCKASSWVWSFPSFLLSYLSCLYWYFCRWLANFLFPWMACSLSGFTLDHYRIIMLCSKELSYLERHWAQQWGLEVGLLQQEDLSAMMWFYATSTIRLHSLRRNGFKKESNIRISMLTNAPCEPVCFSRQIVDVFNHGLGSWPRGQPIRFSDVPFSAAELLPRRFFGLNGSQK